MRAVRREREPAADSISVLESAHERNGEVRRFACRGGEEAKCSGWRRGRLVVSTPATSGWVLWRRDGSDRCVWSPRSRQPVALTRSSGGIGCEGVVDDRGGDRLSVCRVDPVGGHRTGAGLPRAFCSSPNTYSTTGGPVPKRAAVLDHRAHARHPRHRRSDVPREHESVSDESAVAVERNRRSRSVGAAAHDRRASRPSC